MINPFSTIINKLWGTDTVPELNIDEYHDYVDTRLTKELKIVGNKEIIRDESTSGRTKRRRQTVRRDS